MSLDRALRELIRDEIRAELEPLKAQLGRLETTLAELSSVRELASRLSPLFLSAPPAVLPLKGKTTAAPSSRRLEGHPRRTQPAAVPGSGPARGRPRAPTRPCAIVGCEHPSRTKGYCATHYQKRRLLTRTERLPEAWKDDAAPQSVPDVVLPRGRAAHHPLQTPDA